MKKNIIIITGPTGCGKTALSLVLAKKMQGEIINADSVQVYKYFDIGSAKPTTEQLAQVPHHLISILEPGEEFNVGTFCKLADDKILEITNRKKMPIVVGGTGLYIQSLVNGLAEIDDVSSEAQDKLKVIEDNIIASLDIAVANKNTIIFRSKLHNYLNSIDNAVANSVNPEDISRVRRAILVKLSTGTSILSYQKLHSHRDKNYNAFIIILLPQRELIYKLVDERVREMMDKGFLAEVEALREKYLNEAFKIKPFTSIGYKQIMQFKDGNLDYSDVVRDIQKETRRYVKRQFTWWKNQPVKLDWSECTSKLNYTFANIDFEKIVEDVEKIYLEYEWQRDEQGIKFLPIIMT